MAIVYDDIIAGAGSSGAVLAARLSEDSARRVLLLEAGPDYPTIESTPVDLRDSTWISVVQHDWGFKADAVKGREIEYPRGKVVGGSSAVNATIALRGVPADYDEWASLGNSEWAWSRVLPYFRKLEDDQDESGPFHGRGGPIPVRRWKQGELRPLQQVFLDVGRTLGFGDVTDHNHPEATGIGPWPMNQRAGLRMSTAIAYLLPARGRQNLTIRPDSLVNRVVLEGSRAVGVELHGAAGQEIVRGRRVTLCAGAVASPAILLRSGVGPRADIEALGITPAVDLPGVGANLIDHPMCSVALVPRPGVCDKTQPVVQVGLRHTAAGSAEWNDMQLLMISQADLTEIPAIMALVGAPMVFAVGFALQRPRSRGRVSLTGVDPRTPPRIELNYLDDPEDMRRMVASVRLAWRVAQAPAIAERTERIAILTEDMIASDEIVQGYLQMAVNTIYHPVGTARMGPAGDAGAVVDQHGHVRGVDGLSVVDASIMPNVPRANTNLTCIMIGERVADWMRAE
ncbi:MAG TPA: GMC family oxidoreductase N-terminal domain-containing protein [Candidatus Bathyarchaeia archaeon]|nr:GMC family oxidoreductase N-terminal domain-containing protein [Candidatus Bathyarchaeia archaeon]